MLELNINHPVFAVLKAAQESVIPTLAMAKYSSSLLYAQAQPIEACPWTILPLTPSAVCSLMKHFFHNKLSLELKAGPYPL